MKKFVPVIVIANIILLGAILGGFLIGRSGKSEDSSAVSASPEPLASVITNSNEEIIDFANASESAAVKKMGKISGKLCFPSENIPEGVVEAKRIDDGKIITFKYPGIKAAGKATFTYEMESGKYNIRFKAANQIGYHTTVCQTGSETTCSNTSPRTLLTANIEPNETLENYDICDYYYSAKNAPYY